MNGLLPNSIDYLRIFCKSLEFTRIRLDIQEKGEPQLPHSFSRFGLKIRQQLVLLL
jgi:hypothetical protein